MNGAALTLMTKATNEPHRPEQVLECHVFICKRETAANALVRCCFHAYADSTYAHHLENGGGGGPAGGAGGQASAGRGGQPGSGAAPANGQDQVDGDATLNSIEKVALFPFFFPFEFFKCFRCVRDASKIHFLWPMVSSFV